MLVVDIFYIFCGLFAPCTSTESQNDGQSSRRASSSSTSQSRAPSYNLRSNRLPAGAHFDGQPEQVRERVHLAAKGPPKAPKRKTQKRLAKPLLSDSNPEEDEFTTPSQSPLQSPSRDLLHLSPEQHHTFVQATQALLPKVTKNLFSMVARTLDSDEFISQDTLDVMKNKRLPKIRSKDAPIFDGTSDGIKDFIMSLEIIYHTQALTDEAAQVELAAVYAGEKVRKTWFALPEYKAAKWKNFKEAVLSSYNQGKDDEEYK